MLQHELSPSTDSIVISVISFFILCFFCLKQVELSEKCERVI